MAANFDQYSSNLARWQRAQLLDRLILEQRVAQARPSLVVNPLTRQPYDFSELDKSDGLDRSNALTSSRNGREKFLALR